MYVRTRSYFAGTNLPSYIRTPFAKLGLENVRSTVTVSRRFTNDVQSRRTGPYNREQNYDTACPRTVF